jgi:putative ABC transport system substrate-binding protein
MRRREFISLIGSAAAAAWPRAAWAQKERVRHIGVLMGWAESDPYAQSALTAVFKGMGQLGWANDRNLRIDLRWAAGDAELMQKFAKELAALRPEMILANTTPASNALHKETQTIPMVFVIVSDPVGAGLVASLPQPGGNITGFINVETAMGGKWLELLKETAPTVRRAAIMFNPDTAPGGGSYFLGPIEAAARSFGVEVLRTPVRSDGEIEAVINGLGREPGSGLVVMTDGFMVVHRGSIIPLAARNNVPAVYAEAISSRDGGLMSYGANTQDMFARAASYADRILRGAKPTDLPVQTPIKFELVINLKTAKVLGLTVPPTLLARADEVIE